VPTDSICTVAFFPVLRMLRHLGRDEGFGGEGGVFGCLKLDRLEETHSEKKIFFSAGNILD